MAPADPGLARQDMACWWEEVPLGRYYCMRCPCGGVVEALYLADITGPGDIRAAEMRARRRFEEEYPRCPHLSAYLAQTQVPALVLRAASGYVAGVENEITVCWSL